MGARVCDNGGFPYRCAPIEHAQWVAALGDDSFVKQAGSYGWSARYDAWPERQRRSRLPAGARALGDSWRECRGQSALERGGCCAGEEKRVWKARSFGMGAKASSRNPGVYWSTDTRDDRRRPASGRRRHRGGEGKRCAMAARMESRKADESARERNRRSRSDTTRVRVFIEVTKATFTSSSGLPAKKTLAGAERYVTRPSRRRDGSHGGGEVEERELSCRGLRRGGSKVLDCRSCKIIPRGKCRVLAEAAAREGTSGGACGRSNSRSRPGVIRGRGGEPVRIIRIISLTEDARMIILTGPNMAGKSTVLRQVGLIVLMAQVGSFVPASRARIGIVDRLFTRVGASDNLVRGQSTFMVEMSETSAILHTATRRSLVDGRDRRGTSPTRNLDSVVGSESARCGVQDVFATHYHELTQLSIVSSSTKL